MSSFIAHIMQSDVFKASLNSTGGNIGKELLLDVRCIASRAVTKGNACISGIVLGELAGAGGSQHVDMTLTHLGNCSPVLTEFVCCGKVRGQSRFFRT